MKTILSFLVFCQLSALPVLVEDTLSGYDNCNMMTNGESLLLAEFAESKVVFDVGANKGEWSKIFLAAAPKAQIYAFEPVPQIFTQLSSKLQNTTVRSFNLALSNVSHARKTIHFYPKETGMSSLYKRTGVRLSSNAITIQTVRLDDFCRENGIHHIDFLKIDTEGSEWDVIQGASTLFANRAIGAVQFEYGGTYKDANITLEQVYQYLTAQGYEVFRITSEGLVPIRAWRPALENYRYSNYLAQLPANSRS